MKDRIDVGKLEADAKKSCCRETFIVLERNPIVRIGAGARAGDGDVALLFIEINLRLCPGNPISSTISLEKGVQLAKELQEMGYDITCDEGQINFEKVIPRQEINREYQRALKLINGSGLLEPGHGSSGIVDKAKAYDPGAGTPI